MAELSKSIHIDKALENVSVAYTPAEFIAQKLVPKVPVKKESDQYFIYDNQINALEDTIRAAGADARRVTFEVSTSSYTMEEHALSQVIPDRLKQNADKAIRLEIDATETLTRKILIRMEYELASILNTAATWTNKYSLTTTFAWALDTTLSNPLTYVDSATSKIITSSGYRPNVMSIDDATFRGLKNHQQITDRVKYTTADSISENLIAKLMDLDEVVVCRAAYETAAEGSASSMGQIWTNSALIAYMERSPGLMKASAMYNFVKDGKPYEVRKWRDDSKKGDVVEVSTMFKFAAVATQCGYMYVDTT